MKITKRGFPSIMKDNDIKYINYIIRNISEVDDDSDIRFIRNPSNLRITVILSDIKLKKKLIEELKYAHFIIGIEPVFSKCNKLSNAVYIDVPTFD